MRKTFRHFFRPTDVELADLWAHALFSFDASVLLNVYGYSSGTREELVKFLEHNTERVCLPHQFGLEYCRDRCRVIIKQVNNYLKIERELNNIREQQIAPKRDHPYLSKKSLRAYKSIQDELASRRREMEKLVGNDPHMDRIEKVFEGKVGDQPSDNDLSQLHKEAKERYEKGIPPGCADAKRKDVPAAYGDYIAWRQLIKIATVKKIDLILVIDDLKNDWWRIEDGRTVGPLPQLLAEFAQASQQRVWFYNSENFLRAAKQFAAAEIADVVIEEVTERLASQRESRSDSDLKSSSLADLLGESAAGRFAEKSTDDLKSSPPLASPDDSKSNKIPE
jgi:hypothetical protein